MSTYDELVAQARGRRRKEALSDADARMGVLELQDLKRIADAIDRARASEGRPLSEHFVLPDYPGQTADLLRAGKKIGDHGLVVRDGERHYLAHLVVPGRALPLEIEPRSLWRAALRERRDRDAFGPVVDLAVRQLSSMFTVRCGSREQVTAWLTDALLGALVYARKSLVRVTLTPGTDGIQVDVLARADGVDEAPPAIALARAVWLATAELGKVAGGFVSSARTVSNAEERLPELLEDVEAATSLYAGVVERVGDAAEARMELDDPAGLKGALRVAFAGERALSVVMNGELRPPFSSAVTLRPQASTLEKARGLFDKKIGDRALDDAFLVTGNLEAARLLASDANAALVLVGRGATLSLDGNGVHVRLDDLPDEDDALVDVVSACLALWRDAAHTHAGLDAAKASFE